MKRTVIWPPKVVGGRLAMTEDPATDPVDPSAALRQVIRLSVLDGTSTNPWNKGVGTTDQSFKRSDAGTRARLRARVASVFGRLERTHRAKLVGISFPPDPSNPATMTVLVEYTDLETGGRESLEIAPNG